MRRELKLCNRINKWVYRVDKEKALDAFNVGCEVMIVPTGTDFNNFHKTETYSKRLCVLRDMADFLFCKYVRGKKLQYFVIADDFERKFPNEIVLYS